MAGETTATDVNGVQARVYERMKLRNALPGSSFLQREIPFDGGAKRLGESYQFGVVLQPPNGFTMAGSAGNVTTLKQGRPMLIKQASVVPFEMELREQYSFAALSRAAEEGEGTLAGITGEILKAMKWASANRLEATMLLGQYSLATVESINTDSGTTVNVVLTEASTANGLWWANGKGATYDGFTSTTKNNGSGPLIQQSWTPATRTLNVSYTGGTAANEIAAGDVLYYEGSWDGTTYYEMPGLLAQAANTSGTSLGLSAATHPNWAGNTMAVGGVISADVVEQMAGYLRDRGAEGPLTLCVNSANYGRLMSEVKTQRNFDSSYSAEKAKVGVKAIEYESDEVGTIRVAIHKFLPNQYALLFDPTSCGRMGSSDLSFGVPGSNIDAPRWERVTGSTAAEVLLFSDQATCIKQPGHAMVATGITS
jgi:hypothetical protein